MVQIRAQKNALKWKIKAFRGFFFDIFFIMFEIFVQKRRKFTKIELNFLKNELKNCANPEEEQIEAWYALLVFYIYVYKIRFFIEINI